MAIDGGAQTVPVVSVKPDMSALAVRVGISGFPHAGRGRVDMIRLCAAWEEMGIRDRRGRSLILSRM
ncbi:hypothetical protein B1T48_27690 [Mycobacterium persicum]|nr:hypothetical protein B1T48_27690 [Mycobacterium persicum]